MSVKLHSAINTLLSNQIEVPDLVALNAYTAVTLCRRDVTRRVQRVIEYVIRRSEFIVRAFLEGYDLTFGSDNGAVVIEPAVVAGEDLDYFILNPWYGLQRG